MALSEKLYALRKKCGLSQEQLADKLDVSRQSVSKWESGISVPESEKLIAISNYFGVSLDYLMKEHNEQSQPPAESAFQNARQSLAESTVQNAEQSQLFAISTVQKPEQSHQLAEPVHHNTNNAKWLLGIISCIGGIICLIIWGFVSVLNPMISDKLNESSTITMDGNGIFLIICIIAIAVGAVLLFKSANKK